MGEGKGREMSEKKLAYDFWNTPEGIRSQKIFYMMDRIRRLEASNSDLLAALEAARKFIVTAITRGEVIMREYEDVRDAIENAIQKAKGESC
jgi:hypothetical protein